MNSVLDTTSEELITRPCQAQFVKVILKASSENLAPYTLTLFIDQTWWEKIEGASLTESQEAFISINAFDLRVRNAPSKGSSLQLFDRYLKIEHRAQNLDVGVNAKIRVDKTLRWPGEQVSNGVEATLLSGSVVIKNFLETFAGQDLSWIRENSQALIGAELMLGAEKTQIKLPESIGSKKSILYEYIGTTYRSGHSEYLWKLVSCVYEKHLFSPEEVLVEKQEKIIQIARTIHRGEVLEISPVASDEKGVYYLMGKTPKTYLKPGLEIKIFQEEKDGMSRRAFVWEPKALQEESSGGQTLYKLLDYDEIEQLLNSEQDGISISAPQFKIVWQGSQRKLDFVDPAHSTLYLSKTTEKSCVQGKTLWARTKVEEANQEDSWMRLQLNEFTGSGELEPYSTALAKPSENLSGHNLTFYEFDRNLENSLDRPPWKVIVDLDEWVSQNISNRMRMTLSSERVEIEIYKPMVLAKSPSQLFYTGNLKTPSSMPSKKSLEKDLKLASLVFENESNPLKLTLAKGALQLKLEDRVPTFFSARHQVAFYQTSHLAVIDRVSASSANLLSDLEAGEFVFSQSGNTGVSFHEETQEGRKKLKIKVDSLALSSTIKYEGLWLQLEKASPEQTLVFQAPIESVDLLDEALLVDSGQIKQNDFEQERDIQVETIYFRLGKVKVPRDPGHGYVRQLLEKYQVEFQEESTLLKVKKSLPSEHYSTEALMPWVERKFSHPRRPDTDDYNLYHRNLVLEHGEFELAKEYNPANSSASSFRASEAFVQAVRDRYALASNLKGDSTLKNWLPKTDFKVVDPESAVQTDIESNLRYLSEENGLKFPEVHMSWSTPLLRDQKLGIHIQDQNWLEYSVRADLSGETPQVLMKDIPESNESLTGEYQQAINSYLPLLFDSRRYLDNLGVMRELLTSSNQQPWNIEVLSAPSQGARETYFNISTHHQLLVERKEEVSTPYSSSRTSYEKLTQVLATFDGFKVKKDGSVPSLKEGHFQDAPFTLGAFSFYSNIVSDPGSVFKEVDHWPRYLGVPFYVVGLDEFQIDPLTLSPLKLTFKAVLANPEELVHFEPTQDVPNFVSHALREGSVMRFQYTFKDQQLSLLESQCNWLFSVSDQLSKALLQEKMPARLAQLQGDLSVESSRGGELDLLLHLNSQESKAVAFGKVWPLKGQSHELKNHSLFYKNQGAKLNSANHYLQVQYEFHTSNLTKEWTQTPQVVVRIHKEKNALVLDNLTQEYPLAALIQIDSQDQFFRICRIQKQEGEILLYLEESLSDIQTSTVECSLLAYEVNREEEVSEVAKYSLYEGEAQSHESRVKIFSSNSQVLPSLRGMRLRKKTEPNVFYRILEHKVQIEDLQSVHTLKLDSKWAPGQGALDVEIFEIHYLEICARSNPLHFHLPLDLQKSDVRALDTIQAYLSSEAQLVLYLGKKEVRLNRIQPDLVQGHFYCMTIHPLNEMKPQGSLILWIENNFESKGLKHELSGLSIENLEMADPLFQIRMEGQSGSLSPCSLSGFHLTSFGKREKTQYTWANVVYKQDNFILRFEDQDFSKLHTVQRGGKVSFSAYLQLFNSSADMDEEKSPMLQGPVVVSFTKKDSGQLTFFVEQSYYALNTFTFANQSTEPTKPDVQYPLNSSGISTTYRLTEVQLDYQNQAYLSLETLGGSFVVKKMELQHIPINFCLEPNASASISKLSSSQPQLNHRLLFGKLLRSHLVGKLYSRPDLIAIQEGQDEITHFDQQYLLSPIALDDENRLVLMRDHFFLKPSLADGQFQTENILIANRPQSASQIPLYALSHHTLTMEDATADRVIFENEFVRNKMKKKGANGLALRRTLDPLGQVRYSFVPSPFHDLEGQEHLSQFNKEELHFDRFALSSLKSTREVLDNRSIAPKDILRLKQIDFENCYQLHENKPRPNQCCQVEREVTYRYQGFMQESYSFDQPSLYLYETPAFENMDPIWYLPVKEQEKCQRHRSSLGPISSYFLPYQLQVNCGPDKPGAVFHHVLRNVVHTPSSEGGKSTCKVGKSTEFLMREAQQIKVKECLSAAIEKLDVNLRSISHSTVELSSSWEDVFGRISLNNLSNTFKARPGDDPADVKVIDGEMFEVQLQESEEEKLKLICQHNYDVFEIEKLDAALPAYIDEKSHLSWWSRLTLASKIPSLTLDAPVVFEIKDPREPSEGGEGTQEISLDFKPYFSIAKFEILPSSTTPGANFIKVKVPEGTSVNWLEALQSQLKVHVSGMKYKKSASTTHPMAPVTISRFELDEQILTIYFKDIEQLYDHETFEAKELFLVLELNLNWMTKVAEKNNYHLWEMDLKAISLEQAPLLHFQIIWLATASRWFELEDNCIQVMQTGHFNFYPIGKMVKLLMPALTSPKIAGVLHLKEASGTSIKRSYRKTSFFGNSAAPEEALAEIESVAANDHNYRLFAPDQEKVEMSLPTFSHQMSFYLVKYMNRGQVVYDEYPTPEAL